MSGPPKKLSGLLQKDDRYFLRLGIPGGPRVYFDPSNHDLLSKADHLQKF